MQLHQIPHQARIWEEATGKVTPMSGSAFLFSHCPPICRYVIQLVNGKTLNHLNFKRYAKSFEHGCALLPSGYRKVLQLFLFSNYVFFLTCSVKIFYDRESSKCCIDPACALSLLLSSQNELWDVHMCFWQSSVLHAQDQCCKSLQEDITALFLKKYLNPQQWWIMWCSSRGQVC